MSVLFMLLAAVLLLGPLIAIHEWGHYLVARLLGVKVLVYSIGFGPQLLQWTSKKTGIQYRLAALPLGGYVRMLDEREGEVPEDQLPYAFNRQNVWKRLAIVAAGPLTNLLLAVCLFWVLLLPVTEQLNTRIGKVLPNTPAAQAGLVVGDKITHIDGQATPTWEKLNYALLARMGETGQIDIAVEHGQQTVTKTLAIHDFIKDQSQSPLESLGFLPYQVSVPAVLDEVDAAGAAGRQGLKKGDRIVAIDQQPIHDWMDAVNIIQAAPEKLLQFQIQRDQQLLTIAVMPQAHKDAMGRVVGKIGAGVNYPKDSIPAAYKTTIQYTPLEAVPIAFQKTWQLSVMTLESIVKMIKGLIGLENLSGPITIAKIAGQSAQMGWQTFLSFMALMSVSLGVLNLLPIPILDGGHLVYYSIEAIRGRPVSEQAQLIGFKIGLFLLAGMMILAIFNDVMRL